MINKLKPKSEFSKNVLTLMTGTTIAQAIPIAISPILTRIYTPEDFGVFALYMSVATLISATATARYELAIMLPKKDEDAINIMALSIIIAFIVSTITLLLVWFFNAQIVQFLGNPEISNWLYFVPLTVLLTGIYQTFNYWSNRNKQYKRIAVNKVIQTFTMSTVNLGIGFSNFVVNGLILGTISGQGLSTLLLAKTVWDEDSKLLKKIKKIKILAMIKKHKKLPLLNLPNAIIDGFRLSGINLLIAKFFTMATLGQFSLALKMVQVPMALVGSSLSQVFFQKVSSASKNDLYIIIKSFIIKASLVAGPLFILLFLFAEEVFIFIFGDKWVLAGQSASIMTPWLFLNFISSPLSSLFIVLNKQEIMLIFSVFYMIVPLFIIFIFYSQPFIHLLWILTCSMSIMLLFIICLVMYYTYKEGVK